MNPSPDSGPGLTTRNPDHTNAYCTSINYRGHRFGLELTTSAVRTFQIRAIGTLIVLSTLSQVLFHWLGDVPGLRFVSWFFYVDSEHTIPPLYSALTLLCCAALVAVIGWGMKPTTDLWGWRALSLVLALAGLDEYAAIHEKAIEPIRDSLDIDSGPLYYAWVIPGALAVTVLAAMFSGFLRRLQGDTRRRYLVAGILFVFGAIGFEVVAASYVSGGIDAVVPDVDPDIARSGLLYVLLATTEEALEMVGAAIFLTATVGHLENHLGHRLSFAARPIRPQFQGRGREPSFGSAGAVRNGGESTQATSKPGIHSPIPSSINPPHRAAFGPWQPGSLG